MHNNKRPASAILRTRLLDRVDELRDYRVLWVQAPPGCGKTMLLQQYRDHFPGTYLYHRIAHRDTSPSVFFRRLREATCTLPEIGRIPPRDDFDADPRTLCDVHGEELSRVLGSGSLLILDDYDRVPAQSPLHGVVDQLIDWLLPDVRIIVASRLPVPPGFARRRMHDELAVLDWTELLLDRDEAQALARMATQEMNLPDPGVELVEQLRCHVAGWPLGFVALLRSYPESMPQGAAFETWAMQVTSDYFSHEIFDGLPSQTQQAMLKASVLPSLSEDSLLALTAAPGDYRLLENWARMGGFILRNGHGDAAYSYPPAFREFLRGRLCDSFSAGELSALWAKAAAVLAERGDWDEFVCLFDRAKEWLKLSDWLVQAAEQLERQGNRLILRRCLEALPANELYANPWLLQRYGGCVIETDPSEGRNLFRRALTLFEQCGEECSAYLAWTSMVTASCRMGLTSEAADECLKYFEYLSDKFEWPPGPMPQSRIAGALLALQDFAPSHSALAAWAMRAFSLVRTEARHHLPLARTLLRYYVLRGEFDFAREVIVSVGPHPLEIDAEPLEKVMWHACLSGYFWSLGEMSLADENLLTARTVTADDQAGGLGSLLSLQARLYAEPRSLPKRNGVRAKPQMGGFTVAAVLNHLLDFRDAYEAGDAACMAEEAESAVRSANAARIPHLQFFAHAASALAYARAGDETDYWLQIEEALDLTRRTGSTLLGYCLELVLARGALDLGEPDECRQRIASAIDLSQDMAGVIWPFLGRAFLSPLYCEALSASVTPPFVQECIRRTQLQPIDPDRTPDAWPWPVRIFTLGRFEVLLNGEPLRTGRKTQRRPLDLLKSLIALGAQNVPENRLTQAVWSDLEEGDGPGDFKTVLHRLRRMLGHDQALLYKNGVLSLNWRCVWLDCQVFERRLRRSETQRQQRPGDTAVAMPLYLYHGDFLPGDSRVWVLGTRQRLRTKFRQMAEAFGKSLENEDRWQEASDWYRHALERESLSEPLYAGALRSHMRLARHAEAMNIYMQCRHALISQLGVAPGAELVTLYRELLQSPGQDEETDQRRRVESRHS